ncbi:MAG: HAMP domain-containing sensor histidine kinase [Gemmatimonadota bacterium]|jgi:signal transduction histidine kinase
MAAAVFVNPVPVVMAQGIPLDDVQHLMLINVLLVLLIVGFSGGIALALVRRSMRERVKAERLAAMGTATARILHQVKNPLQTILLHAEMLQDQRLVSDEALRREICDAIIGEAMRMTDLLAGLSAYAAGMARRLKRERMSLDGLVREIAETVGREGAREAVEVRIGPIEPAVVEGDESFLREAIGNVIRNAREALREREADGEAVLEISLRRRGGEVVIEVSDNGPGIDPERAAQVFEPFTTTKPKGMGLGLPICREIVEGHGGRVELRSKRGVGTTVQIILPLATSLALYQPA